jgi:hypothetical protein
MLNRNVGLRRTAFAQCNIPEEQNHQRKRRANRKPRTETEKLMMQSIDIRATLFVFKLEGTIITLN